MRLSWFLALLVAFAGMNAVVAQEKEEPPSLIKSSEKQDEPFPPADEVAAPASELTPSQLRELAAALKINAALDKEAKFAVTECPLSKLLSDLAVKHKIPIVLDPEGCEIANISPDLPITLKLDGISLRNALRALLKPLQLSFIVRNEVLLITALDCPERLATVRTFPLGDLVKRMDDSSELIAALEIMWPDVDDFVDREKTCKPRARILAGHLVVRGSPRHLDLAEQLIDGLMTERPSPPKVKELEKPHDLLFKTDPKKDPVPIKKPKAVDPDDPR